MKLLLVTAVALVALLVTDWRVEAEFLHDRIIPKEELKDVGLKCMPGRTVVRIEDKTIQHEDDQSDEESDIFPYLRTHMNAVPNDEPCHICVCSVEGKDEYCSTRMARNVNECLRLSVLKEELEKTKPYSYDRTLSYRIRRDYIWHDDEIPYEGNAKCRRGRSYYSNSVNANDTDIDVGSDITTLLGYHNEPSVCFFCVCASHGRGTACIPRDGYFCEYYRIIGDPDAARNEYRAMFEQDRPAYFRQLSYRLRRRMDDGMFDLMENGGDTLCCGHPDGHRRSLHEQVRNKIRIMRRKVPKENIMAGSPGGDYVDFIVNND